ncbi:MAG: TonB-dependent receptor [Bacteroidales bacterium]|nr:TonB-dependent receptor [Bacteroidales bacterium]MCF8391940.1 TonB-dependent receptor [Bacteroidales bacterium]
MPLRTLLSFFFILSVFRLIAQPDTLVLDEVVISIIPFQDNNDKSTSGFISIYVPGLDFKQVLNNSELINLAPGVFMAEGTYNTNRLVIRGIGSRTPYGSNRIRVYLDDIPLTSGDGVSSVEDIDAFSIGSIEIVKGPSSALYGAGLGGILKLSTSYPEEQGLTLYQSNDVGSFSTFQNNIFLTFKKNRMAITSGYSRTFSDGFRENSRFERSNLFLNARYYGLRTNIFASMNLVDLYSQIPSSLNFTDYSTSPWKAAGNWLSAEGFEEYLKALAGVTFETTVNENLSNKLVLFSKYANPYERRPFNILDESSISYGFRESLSYDAGEVKFSAGLEYYRDHFNWQIYETLEEGQGMILSDNAEKRQYLNAFSFVRWNMGSRFTVDAGLNVNMLKYNLETIFESDSTDNTGKYKYKPVVSPRLGMNYQFMASHFLYASIGHGFSHPSLEETLMPEGTVNTGLKPEEGWNIELGERGYFLSGRISYDITAYLVYLKNLLVTERLSEEVFYGINAGTVLNSGVEILGQISLLKPIPESKYELKMILGMTLSDNQFKDFTDEGVSYNGRQLPGIPGQVVHTTFMGRAGAFSTRLQYKYVGKQWMDDANLNRSEGYNLLNFQLAWKPVFPSSHFGIELFGGIKNLLNTSYASMVLVNAPSFGGNAPRYYYPGLPRQIHAGLAIRFKD